MEPPPAASRPSASPRRRSPFTDVGGGVVPALAFAVACLVWVVAGARLPGGRWLAVHLFTLGVLSNLVLAFTRHFATTLTHTPARSGFDRTLLVFNLGAVTTMVGMAGSWRIATGLGATLATTGVLLNHLDLRRMRRAALGARFAWIVRNYERGHGAFVHGALLGALMGAGVLSGPWYGAARLAHLHVNLLGWAGSTLLATIVFFGPTMARTRIEPGADERAAGRVRLAAHGVTTATLLLLASAVGGTVGGLLRIAAAMALALFAWGVSGTCRPVVRAVQGAGPGAAREPIAAVGRWFTTVAWLDVLVVATGAWRLLDALGLALLLGVLVQSIATTLVYVAPMLARSRGGGKELRATLEGRGRVRAAIFNTGTLLVVATAAVGSATGVHGAVVARIGWALVLAGLLHPIGLALGRGGRTEPVEP